MNENKLYDRLDDLVYLSNKNNRELATNFLNELEIIQAKNYLKCNYQISNIPINASKKIISINANPNDFLVCLVCDYNNDYIQIRHQDVLGALSRLNYKLDVIGDIFVLEDKIVIYVLKKISKDVIENLTKINQLNTKFTISNINYYKQQEYIESTINIASTRLDSIVGGIINGSRNQASELIINQYVKVNHLVSTKVTKSISNSDIISIRGHGRYIFDGIRNETKKGRFIGLVRKYN